MLEKINSAIRHQFDEGKQVLSFEDYFKLVDQDPIRYLRNGAAYVHDAVTSLGAHEQLRPSGKTQQWRVFENTFNAKPRPILGQEDAQNTLIKILTGFVRTGRSDKLIVFHGPNGSAKTSLVQCLFEAIEHYSKTDAGRLFHFSWIFPVDSLEKNLGFGRSPHTPSNNKTFADLDQNSIGAIVRSELHENPIFLIPSTQRQELFKRWMDRCPAKDRPQLEALQDYFLRSELSQKNAMIFEAILNDYQGDFQKVLRHIRVERFVLSANFRKGLVVIQPQFGVDANIRQVTLDRSLANLPAALQSLNLFQLEGDLVDANRGVVLYDDFLKRPLDSFKYLLNTIENGAINLANVVAFLDTLFLATTNDHQLQGFREYADYNSFKARMEFIRVPYLLRISEEEKIYAETARTVAAPKELLPHTTRLLATWAILTRLKRPLLKNKSALLSRILENITPLEKARIYDSGDLPARLNEEEKRELRSHISDLYREHESLPYYEGLLGASARELKLLLQLAAQNEQYPTLGPNAIFAELKQLVKKTSDYEYLRQEALSGYHNFEEFIQVCRMEWHTLIDREMWESTGLKDQPGLNKTLTDYMTRIIKQSRGEKIKNTHTGKYEDADTKSLEDFESLLGVAEDRNEFRKNLISRIGAWSIDNQTKLREGESVPFDLVFPDLMKKINQRFYDQQTEKIKAMARVLLDSKDLEFLNHPLNESQSSSEAHQLALETYRQLQAKFNYGPEGAKEVLLEILKERYR